MKGDLKALIIAEYERTKGSVEQVRQAVGSDSYDYVALVLRIHRGDTDARTERATAEAHKEHVMSVGKANNGRGFPFYAPKDWRAA